LCRKHRTDRLVLVCAAGSNLSTIGIEGQAELVPLGSLQPLH